MTEDILRRFAQRARQETFFLGAMMDAYQQNHGCDDVALAELLDCRVDDLHRLAACRAPSELPGSFRTEVVSIAKYGSCNPEKLAMLVREVAATTSLRDESVEGSSAGFMLAARDRKSASDPTERESHATDGEGS